MSVHAGKTLLTMILNGGSIPTAHEKVRYLQSLRKASRLLRMLACTQLPDVWAALRDEGRKWLDWINRESSGKDGGINRICSLVTVCLFVPCFSWMVEGIGSPTACEFCVLTTLG
jgi:hypothetical protein